MTHKQVCSFLFSSGVSCQRRPGVSLAGVNDHVVGRIFASIDRVVVYYVSCRFEFENGVSIDRCFGCATDFERW